MRIIGEKINGTLEQVSKAIKERNATFIQDLARRQVEAGADLVDVNAGTRPDEEPEALSWLVKIVQEAVHVPLCLDSANPGALAVGLKEVKQTPFVNSISGEKTRLEGILPLVGEYGCSVIALALDEHGIPQGVEGRLSVIRRVIERTRKAGVPDDRVYVDPLVIAISTDAESGKITLETMRAVCAEFPAVHLCVGLGNISFGLPVRGLINRVFLTLGLAAGMDTAIMDPLDQEMRAELLAAELVLGRDPYCQNYTRAYRAGRIRRH